MTGKFDKIKDRVKKRMDFIEKNDHPDTLYGALGLSQVLEVHENTIRNWRRAGKIHGTKISVSRGYAFRVSDVIADLKKLYSNGEEK